MLNGGLGRCRRREGRVEFDVAAQTHATGNVGLELAGQERE
jgi:hypothetical protein